jgi:hypothetical protein
MQIETDGSMLVVASMGGAIEYGGGIMGPIIGPSIWTEGGRTPAPIWTDPAPPDYAAMMGAIEALRQDIAPRPRPRMPAETPARRTASLAAVRRALDQIGRSSVAEPELRMAVEHRLGRRVPRALLRRAIGPRKRGRPRRR